MRDEYSLFHIVYIGCSYCKNCHNFSCTLTIGTIWLLSILWDIYPMK